MSSKSATALLTKPRIARGRLLQAGDATVACSSERLAGNWAVALSLQAAGLAECQVHVQALDRHRSERINWVINCFKLLPWCTARVLASRNRSSGKWLLVLIKTALPIKSQCEDRGLLRDQRQSSARATIVGIGHAKCAGC